MRKTGRPNAAATLAAPRRASLIAATLPAIALSTLALTACDRQTTSEPSPAASAVTDATPENAPGVTLTDAVVQLPAVAGRPGVAYFSVSQGNGAPRKLVAVHVDGAGSAQMHESMMADGVASMAEIKELPLEAGKAVEFAPGGRHVMLFDIDPALKVGGITEMTITLDNGDKASVPAKIEGPAGSGATMGHM